MGYLVAGLPLGVYPPAMKSSNPMLRDKVLRQTRAFTGEDTGVMTVDGTLSKVALLLITMTGFAVFAWNSVNTGSMGVSSANGMMLGGGLLGFAISIVLMFKPQLARVLAVPFAICEGVMLGAVSAVYQVAFYPNIVLHAVLLTVSVSMVMFFLWRTGIIKVTDRTRSVIGGAMGGIVLIYLATFVLGMFGVSIPMIHGNGLIGIGFSAVVLVVVSFMLTVDFDMIQRMSQGNTPKAMEWYGAFALLVTLIWLYLELLRMLSKLSSRD